MTTEELLEQMEKEQSSDTNESHQKCVITPETREIEIPDSHHILGVVSDEKAEKIWFQCSKIVGDDVDLSKLQIRVNYQNAAGEKDQYIVDDVEIREHDVVFSWLLSRKVTAYNGLVSFAVCAVEPLNGKIKTEWNTTIAQAEVLDGIEVEEPIPQPEESDLISQLIEMMENTQKKSDQALETAESIVSGQLQQIVPTIRNHVIVFDYISQEGG